MVAFCAEHGIAHEICGKVMVATRPDELPRLDELHRRGIANGVPGLEMIGPERLREIEPHAAGPAGAARRVDRHHRLRRASPNATPASCASAAARSAPARACSAMRRDGDEWVVETTAGAVRTPLPDQLRRPALRRHGAARRHDAAGAHRAVPRRVLRAGARTRESLVRALIYPVPDPAFPFLGVHFTRMVDGGVEAGPNAVLSFKREGYRKTDFDAARGVGHAQLSRLLAAGGQVLAHRRRRVLSLVQQGGVRARAAAPAARSAHGGSAPGGAGVRAQAIDPGGALVDDFSIQALGGVMHVLERAVARRHGVAADRAGDRRRGAAALRLVDLTRQFTAEIAEDTEGMGPRVLVLLAAVAVLDRRGGDQVLLAERLAGGGLPLGGGGAGGVGAGAAGAAGLRSSRLLVGAAYAATLIVFASPTSSPPRRTRSSCSRRRRSTSCCWRRRCWASISSGATSA